MSENRPFDPEQPSNSHRAAADKTIHTMVPFMSLRDLIKDAQKQTGPGVCVCVCFCTVCVLNTCVNDGDWRTPHQ